MRIHNIFWMLTSIVFICLLLPLLVQDGMFLDGVTYSAISNNLANGIGTFLKPCYTKTLFSTFHEHPPLVFGITSLFYKILGDSIFVERLYTFLTAIITAVGIVLFWRLLFKQKEYYYYTWVPVFLWITVPRVFWAYSNNMLENTMGVFTLFSAYFITKSIMENKIYLTIIGSFFIILAFLSKGPVGLFPLSIPMVYFLVFKDNRKQNIRYFLILLFFTASISYFLAWLFPELKQNIVSYLDEQLLPSLKNKREITTENRFSILFTILADITLPILIGLLFIVKNRKRKILNQKYGFYFLIVALSASIPLILTLKQSSFYSIPSIPFYILSISAIIVPFIKIEVDKISNRTQQKLLKISYALFVLTGIFIFSRTEKYSRDENMIKDVRTISKYVHRGSILSTSKKLSRNWGLIAYMSRINYLSITSIKGYDYFLVEKNKKISKNVLKNYDTILSSELRRYILLKKKIKN